MNSYISRLKRCLNRFHGEGFLFIELSWPWSRFLRPQQLKYDMATNWLCNQSNYLFQDNRFIHLYKIKMEANSRRFLRDFNRAYPIVILRLLEENGK